MYVIDVAIHKLHVGPILLGYKTRILCTYRYRMYTWMDAFLLRTHTREDYKHTHTHIVIRE